MNGKTIVILIILAVIILGAFKALWKHLKGEGSCSCGGTNCSGKKESDHKHGEDGCCCHKK